MSSLSISAWDLYIIYIGKNILKFGQFWTIGNNITCPISESHYVELKYENFENSSNKINLKNLINYC